MKSLFRITTLIVFMGGVFIAAARAEPPVAKKTVGSVLSEILSRNLNEASKQVDGGRTAGTAKLRRRPRRTRKKYGVNCQPAVRKTGKDFQNLNN